MTNCAAAQVLLVRRLWRWRLEQETAGPVAALRRLRLAARSPAAVPLRRYRPRRRRREVSEASTGASPRAGGHPGAAPALANIRTG
jgi:hypothetical protein